MWNASPSAGSVARDLVLVYIITTRYDKENHDLSWELVISDGSALGGIHVGDEYSGARGSSAHRLRPEELHRLIDESINDAVECVPLALVAKVIGL